MTRSRIPRVIAGLFLVGVILSWGVHEADAGPGGGTYYANSPAGTWTDYAGVVHASGTPLRKFINRLPGLGVAGCDNTPLTGSCGANENGQYIPIAKKLTDPSGHGDDYYEIGIVEYSEKMHTDLPKATSLRGYKDLAPGTAPVAHYLGPLIIATENKPVRLKVTNMLSTGASGKLLIPVDNTYMGAGLGPLDNTTLYTQNRTSVHLHGGNTPWISDGTPHQWFTPATETSIYRKGVSQHNVPDMPVNTLTTGSETLYYTNQQSGRLMFYHEHALGITRLGVYAGLAAGYLLVDNTEIGLINSGILPNQSDLGANYLYGIPLVIQDKTFVPQDVNLQDALWNQDANGNPRSWGQPGDLWYPHVYETNQDPYAFDGANPFGRWDYGPWFWPPLDPSTLLGPLPEPSGVPEGFMDTPLVNGTAYPYLVVQPKAYRFRILNASNDRMWNLQLYYADNTIASGAPGYGTEVKMVPAASNPGFPGDWPLPDGRDGGFPDPAMIGPSMIQIGTEGGFLPAPAVIPNRPVGYNYNRRDITVLNVQEKALFLGPAERADVIIDFSSVPSGSNIILYSDAPAPVPAFDSRNDYYTGDPDQTMNGGAPTTLPGYGPNTRTIMQFRVSGTAAAAYNVAALDNALPVAFAAAQPAPIIPEPEYGTAYLTTFPEMYSTIESTSFTFTPLGSSQQVTIPFVRKAIHELFELNYGRMNALLGVELPLTNFFTQTTLPYGYIDPPTELWTDGQTQIWKISHNGVDTHAIHFHMVNVQLINRVGWDGMIKPPDANELGWKETIRMNPLEDVIVAMTPKKQTLPAAWGTLPDSIRPLDPTSPPSSTMGFANVDPATGNPISVTNDNTNFGYEYVWHCHLLGHEENDMMRAIVFRVPLVVPATPSGLTATLAGIDNNIIDLLWDDNSSDEIAFRVERSTNGGAFTAIQTVYRAAFTTQTTYTDTALSPNTTYTYRVFAFNAVGDSGASNTSAPVTTGTFAATTGVTLSSHPISPQPIGTIVTFVATASGGTGIYQYQFEQRLAGAGSWTVAQAYSLDNNWMWNTSTFPAGNYEIHVLARTMGGTGAAAVPATSTTMPFVLTTPPASAVTLAAIPATSATVGSSVTFTSVASGGTGTYQYQFERRQAGTTAWTIVQAYSSANTFVWNTTGVATGNYEFQTLARNAGSTAASEATSGVLSYALTASVGPATGVTLTPVPASPQPPGSSISFIAAGSGGSGTYEYQFSDNVSGVMTVVRAYNASSAWVWNTTGLANGTYGIKVDVRVVGSVAASEATASIVYTLAPLPATSVILTPPPSPASPQSSGTSVLWTAVASGGSGNYQYQFWLRNTSGTWSIAKPYGATNDNTWTWNTTGLPAGTYTVEIWARSAGSSATWEAFSADTPYVLSISAATSVILTPPPSPASPQSSGTSVLWTAVASGGSGNYQYQFWLRNTSGTWSIAKPYGATNDNTWTWNTTGLPAGTYTVEIWARSAGSSATWEAFSADTPYVLSISAATSVILTPPPSPASPQSSGTSVLWTAVASGGSGNYQYQFWLRNTSGTWSIAKPYGATNDNTWTWNTTGLPAGTYTVEIWARSAGSSATWEAFSADTPYVLSISAATSVILTPPPSPASPQSSGTSVLWTAVASGGSGNYQYQFWLRNTSGTWSIAKPYGATNDNTWTWNTTGLPAGTYTVEIWARSAGSSATWEAFSADTPYVLQ